uniref:Uncharacterized protein n=1 Tax=viral metagenome TaxID=1070528 RepID=A0A6C0D745_9ZZZZ
MPLPFVINDDTKIDNTKSISTNLYSSIMPIYYTEKQFDTTETAEPGEIITGGYEKTFSNGGFIKIPYNSPAATIKPNATYIDNVKVTNYKTKTLYITKPSHVIQDPMDSSKTIAYDAEMAIEMEPITNGGSNFLYLFFLLKLYRDDNKTPENDIDRIIVNSINPSKRYKRTQFNLQPLIDNNQKKIVYKSDDKTFIIFTKIINIKEINGFTFDNPAYYPRAETLDKAGAVLYSSDYKIITPHVTEGFKEGVTGETKIMTCTPINTGEPTEKDNSMVFTNTDYGTNSTSRAILLGIVVTIVIIFISIFGVPPVYFSLMNSNNLTPGERNIYNIVFIVSLTVLGLYIGFNGLKNNPVNQPLAGGIILIFVVLSVLGIRLHNEKLILIGCGDLASESMSVGFTAIMKKWNQIYKYVLGSWVLLIIFFIIIVYAFVRKRKFDTLLGKSDAYIRNLSKILLGVGITYGFIFISLIGFFVTPQQL